MSIDLEKFRWDATGVEPTESRKNIGRAPGERVPADEYNFYLNQQYNAFKDLVEKATSPFTTSASIESLPIGSVEGKVSNFEGYGLTLDNSVENGDFSDGTTGWTAAGSTGFSVSNQIASFTPTGSFGRVQQSIKPKENDKYFIYAKVKASKSTVQFGFSGTTKAFHNGNGDYLELYKFSFPSASTTALEILDSSTSDWDLISVDGNAGVHVINLTALGLEPLTESQLLDLVRSGYIDGLQSVMRPKVESVGKNLFDVNNPFLLPPLRDNYISENKIYTASNISFYVGTVYDFKLKGGTTYKLGFNLFEIGGNATGGRITTSTGLGFNFTSIGAKTIEITTPSDGNMQLTFGRIGGANDNLGWAIYSELQLEEGTVATAYEPHQSSQLTADVVLRHVPTTPITRDRIYESDGKLWKEKQIEEYALESGDIEAYTTTLTNYDYVRIFRNQLPGIVSQPTVDGSKHLIVDGFTRNTEYSSGSLADTSSYIGTYIDDGSLSSAIFLIVPKGTYANLAAAQADLAGTKVIYQLATPELINLTEQGLVSGELFSFENGTVYNTSDTFHAQDVSFDVPTNEAAQRESNIDAVQSLNNRLDGSKPLTLLNQTLISTNWINDTANADRPFWYYQIPMVISEKNIPGFSVNPLDKLNGKADDLTNDIESFDGYVRIYATPQPTQDFTVDVEVIR